MHDVLIIGAGVVGCSVARALASYAVDAVVLERNLDVGEATSKANSGIVHAGYDAHPGTSKAFYNLRGSRQMAAFAAACGVPYRNNGSLVLGFADGDRDRLLDLLRQGTANGVAGLEILSGEAARALEPELSPAVAWALHAPTGGIVDPFQLTIAQAEIAAVNGVRFVFEARVDALARIADGYAVETPKGRFEGRTVVNCAGVHADVLNNAVSTRRLTITPRKGEYCLFDKAVGTFVDRTIFQLPTPLGKGVLVTPTAEGNLLTGPTAVDVVDRDDVATTPEGLAEVLRKARISTPALPTGFVITAFAGLRATEKGGDFVIGEAPGAPGFFNAAGIESPGLTAAPVIGDDLAAMVAAHLGLLRKPQPLRPRPPVVRFEAASLERREALVAADPDYGRIVCRCELVTAAEVRDAIRRPLGATTLDGVKRRVRAGSGRCQGGFCTPKVMRILAEELGIDPLAVAKNAPASTPLVGRDKEVF